LENGTEFRTTPATNGDAWRYLELLDRRIHMLGSLAEALTAARRDMVCLDVHGLAARIAQQENLCRQVRALDGQLDQLQRHCASQVRATSPSTSCGTPVGGEETLELLRQLAQARERMKSAQDRVKALNQSHQALLRRCRRTTSSLLNSYATFATSTGTYPDPSHGTAQQAALTYSRERR
jgi:hypothetical protein